MTDTDEAVEGPDDLLTRVRKLFHDGLPQAFLLDRNEDVTGISGTGAVAEGVRFSDGTVALRWKSEWPTSVVFHDRGVEAVEAVHGHDGRTRIVWLAALAAADGGEVERPDDWPFTEAIDPPERESMEHLRMVAEYHKHVRAVMVDPTTVLDLFAENERLRAVADRAEEHVASVQHWSPTLVRLSIALAPLHADKEGDD